MVEFGLNAAVPSARSPSANITKLPGARLRVRRSMAISSAKAHGAPSAKRRPRFGRSFTTGRSGWGIARLRQTKPVSD